MCFYTVQGYNQLQLLVENLGNPDKKGKSIRQDLEYLYLVARVSTPIMSNKIPATFTEWTEDKWLIAIEKFLMEINSRVQVSNVFTPQEHREGGAFIMEGLQGINWEMQQYSRCRMHLQVLTLAEIITPGSTKLNYRMIAG